MATAPYDQAEVVLNLTRTRVNDAIASPAGNVLTDTNPNTTTMFNGAWRRLQEFLVSKGYTTLEEETVFSVPAATNTDPSGTFWIDWTGCNTGSGGTLSSPVLPQDLIRARKCWEENSFGMQEMDEFKTGLPGIAKQPWLGSWEWRQNRLYLIGATAVITLRIRYASYLADFTSLVGSGSNQLIPIMRASDSLSWYLCDEVCKARGDADSNDFVARAEAAAMKLLDQDFEVPTGIQKLAEYQKMKDPAYAPMGQ